MNRRKIILTAFAAVIAATTTTTALAASGAKNPKAMVLQKSDFPAGARLLNRGVEKEPGLHAYDAAWKYKVGAKRVVLYSSAMVVSPRFATRVSRQSELEVARQGFRKITLPKYGDEQLAFVVPDVTFAGAESNRGELIVRKGSVIWNISVYTLTGAVLTKAEAIAQLKRYAPKQMKRVGSG